MPIPNKPIPTKFEKEDDALIRLLALRSGLKKAEVIRRCVRVMGLEAKKRGARWNWVRETAMPFTDAAMMKELAALEAGRAPYAGAKRGRKTLVETPSATTAEAAEWLQHAESDTSPSKPTPVPGKPPKEKAPGPAAGHQ